MSLFQKEIQIDSKPRGFNLITNDILSKVEEIKEYRIGIMHLFIKHRSASLTINENADSTVREDMESYFNKFVPENEPYYKHTFEGSDEKDANIKLVNEINELKKLHFKGILTNEGFKKAKDTIDNNLAFVEPTTSKIIRLLQKRKSLVLGSAFILTLLVILSNLL